MKLKFILMILPAILIESAFLPYPLVFTVIFIINYYFSELPPEMLFFSGLILDLFSLRLLGTDSLMFLSISLINSLYAKKLQSKSLPFQIFLYAIFIVIYNLFNFGLSNPVTVFWEIGIGLTVLFLFEKVLPRPKTTGKKLSL